jgi:hypothetical protein
MRQLALAMTLGTLALCATAPAAWSQSGGGPVILGGDDLTSHGSRDSSTGASREGWLYMERAVGNIKSRVRRANDNSIAAFGSADPGATFPGGDAGAGIKNAAQKNGMSVRFFNGAAAINSAMAQISNGSYRPAIMWVAGDDASNDLGSEGPCTDTDPATQTEGEALVRNAGVMDRFVNGGGGLLSHGVCYPWLSALLPGLQAPESGNSGDLYLTPQGRSAFPGVTESDVNAGPWHNHFQGNFGGLQLLVRSRNVNDNRGQDAAVIIGGAQVSLVRRPPPPPAASPAAPPAAPAAPPDRTRPRISLGGVLGRGARSGTCARRAFRVRIRIRDASRLRRADVYVSGRRVRRTTRKRFSVRVSVRGLRAGRNRITVIVRDTAGNRAVSRIRFNRCAAAVARPRFTG